MKDKTRGWESKHRSLAVAALVAFGAGTLCWVTAFLAPLDRSFHDFLTRSLESPIDSDVVIVEIDARSLHELGAWPWHRSRHAEIIERLQSLGARRLFVDIDFSSPSAHPEDDERLAAALANARVPIVLPAFVQPFSSHVNALILSEPLGALTRNPQVREGSVNLIPGADGLVREIPDLTSLLATPTPPVWTSLMPSRPAKTTQALLLDYRIAPASFGHYSYVDILQGRATPDLSGKTILIGATAIELGDIVPVPIHQALAGVVVQAIAYETAQRVPLRPLSVYSRVSLLLTWAFVCAIWLSTTTWRRVYVAAATLLSVLLAANVLAYAAGDVIFAPSPFLATWLAALAAAQLRWLNIESLRSWRASLRLGHQDALLRRIVETSIDGILTVDAAGNVRDANHAAAKLLKIPPSELGDRPINALLPSLDALLSQLSPSAPVLERPVDLVRADGSSLPTEIVLTQLAWEDTHVTCVCIRDVSAHRERERELRYHATHDGLTGLPNRRLLAERLGLALDAANATRPFALLMLDLDGFKQVNDTFGHGTGDDLLLELGRRLQTIAASSQCVARVGGDEFALLLTEAQTEHLQAIYAELRHLLEAPTIVHGVPISLGTSIGVSLYPQHGTDSESLMRRADIALYCAKRKRSAIEVYDNSLDNNSPRRLQMLSELRSAIARNEFTLHFQPKVLLTTALAVEVEALCRWRSPVFGDVPAGEFIPLVEASELIRPFTEWTLRYALECCRGWREQGCDLSVAVNLSARHLQDEQLPAWLSDFLHATGTDPDWLELEITESAIMTDIERALKILQAIRRLGIKLSIDDYGTGYSSLAYLQKLAASRLKIDRSFVSGLGRSEHDKLIVKSTIDLAHGLGLEVIAEGIENQTQYSMLQGMGCDYGQGYLIARAMPMDLLVNWYKAQRTQPRAGSATVTAMGRV